MIYRLTQLLLYPLVTLFLGCRIRGLENLPRTGGVLIIANHQSYLDPVLLGVKLYRKMSFMARESLFANPLFGWVLRRVGGFPVKRGSPDLEAVREAIARLKDGGMLCIFPEGTRSADGKIGKLKSGYSLIARRAEVPIVPAYIRGAFKAWPRNNRFPRPAGVEVCYGEAVPVETVKSFSAEALEDLIAKRLLAMEAQGVFSKRSL